MPTTLLYDIVSGVFSPDSSTGASSATISADSLKDPTRLDLDSKIDFPSSVTPGTSSAFLEGIQSNQDLDVAFSSLEDSSASPVHLLEVKPGGQSSLNTFSSLDTNPYPGLATNTCPKTEGSSIQTPYANPENFQRDLLHLKTYTTLYYYI